MKDYGKRVLAYLKAVFTRNVGMKLLALVLAILLWSFVVSTTNPVRVKIVEDVIIEARGLPQLTERGLIIKNEYPGTADVRLDVPQNDYNTVTANNVTCYADFSRITEEGEQRVYLTATSTSGDAVGVTPAFITIEVEQQLTRDVPIRTQLTGEVSDGYWRGAPTLNRNVLSVTGARSVVESIGYAEVTINVEGAFETVSESLDYALYTDEGVFIEKPGNGLTTSPNNCVATVEVLPINIVPVELITTGDVAEGYLIYERSVTPAYVRIAAAQDVLDGIKAMLLTLSLDGAADNIDTRIKPQMPTGVKWCEMTDIAVSIAIKEEETTKTFERLDVLPFNAMSDDVSIDPASVTVEITGPRSVVNSLARSEIQPYVDLNGREAGEYLLSVLTQIENSMPELDVKVLNQQQVAVTIR